MRLFLEPPHPLHNWRVPSLWSLSLGPQPVVMLSTNVTILTDHEPHRAAHLDPDHIYQEKISPTPLSLSQSRGVWEAILLDKVYRCPIYKAGWLLPFLVTHTHAHTRKFIYTPVWLLKGLTSPIFLHKLKLYISISSVHDTCPTPTLACCSYNTTILSNAQSL